MESAMACGAARSSSGALHARSRRSRGRRPVRHSVPNWPASGRPCTPSTRRCPCGSQRQKAVIDVLKGSKELTTDVRELKLHDKAGQLDAHCPLLDEIRVYLSRRQDRKERTLGKDLIGDFENPPYGWDPAALRVGVAAMVRAAAIRIVIGKKPYTNPEDGELQHALRVSRDFDKVEVILEESEADGDTLTAVRSLLMKLTGKRKIDETPAALAAEMENFGKALLEKADKTALGPSRRPSHCRRVSVTARTRSGRFWPWLTHCIGSRRFML